MGVNCELVGTQALLQPSHKPRSPVRSGSPPPNNQSLRDETGIHQSIPDTPTIQHLLFWVSSAENILTP